MAEYIEREAALERIEKLFQLQASTARAIIEAIPSADVQPVRHGRWINRGWSTVCSECGEDYAFAKRNYCPNCGAKMDGET